MGTDRTRTPDPRRLDVARAAREGYTAEGAWPLAGFDRLREGDAVPEGDVHWSARAGARPRAGAAPEIRLWLAARAQVERTCQRCLQSMQLPLEVERQFLFVANEDLAAELDADNDQEDVLELTPRLDLHALVEEELLLALPIVPRHETCPQPLAAAAPEPADAPTQAHPFAALARLRRPADG
jgi:uncharacterized protein